MYVIKFIYLKIVTKNFKSVVCLNTALLTKLNFFEIKIFDIKKDFQMLITLKLQIWKRKYLNNYF